MQYSILILKQRGVQIDWVPVEYFGPFTSPEEREAWLQRPENAVDDGFKYAVEFLRL